MTGLEDYTTAAGTRLYGREGELRRLESLARTRRLTVLYGSRGLGRESWS